MLMVVTEFQVCEELFLVVSQMTDTHTQFSATVK